MGELTSGLTSEAKVFRSCNVMGWQNARDVGKTAAAVTIVDALRPDHHAPPKRCSTSSLAFSLYWMTVI